MDNHDPQVDTEPRCCGAGGGWSRPGEAFVLGCQLCTKSPTYWRTATTAAKEEATNSQATAGEEQ